MSLVRYHRGLRTRLLSGHPPAWLQRHPRRAYIVMAILSRPAWCGTRALRKLDARRQLLGRLTGVEHVLDHIIPLNHPHVCGLTVPENLRIVPRRVNAAKGNAWCDSQGDLFGPPEPWQKPLALRPGMVRNTNGTPVSY